MAERPKFFIDEDSNTRIYVSGSVALTIRPNGVIGIGNNGNDSYLMYGNGQAYFTSGFRGSRFVDMSGGVCDPSDESTLSNLTCSGVTKIILPTSTNGLTSGMLWNDAGTIKVKP